MSRLRAVLAPLAAVLLAAATLLPATAASAATPPGWVRLAHLSPDTEKVNVTLSGLTGDTVLYRLRNVGYGQVSKYMRLPAGTYAIAMTPSEGPSTPIVKASVEVKAGAAVTVAAMGRNKDLTPKVFVDDLSTASGSGARVRVVQASTVHPRADVNIGSAPVAQDLRFGAASEYASVPAGRTTFRLTSGSADATASRTFAAGTVHTVFVLDDAENGLALGSVSDSASSVETPVGSVETGGGADAGTPLEPLAGLLAAITAAGSALAAAALIRRPRVAQPLGE